MPSARRIERAHGASVDLVCSLHITFLCAAANSVAPQAGVAGEARRFRNAKGQQSTALLGWRWDPIEERESTVDRDGLTGDISADALVEQRQHDVGNINRRAGTPHRYLVR